MRKHNEMNGIVAKDTREISNWIETRLLHTKSTEASTYPSTCHHHPIIIASQPAPIHGHRSSIFLALFSLQQIHFQTKTNCGCVKIFVRAANKSFQGNKLNTIQQKIVGIFIFLFSAGLPLCICLSVFVQMWTMSVRSNVVTACWEGEGWRREWKRRKTLNRDIISSQSSGYFECFCVPTANTLRVTSNTQCIEWWHI